MAYPSKILAMVAVYVPKGINRQSMALAETMMAFEDIPNESSSLAFPGGTIPAELGLESWVLEARAMASKARGQLVFMARRLLPTYLLSPVTTTLLRVKERGSMVKANCFQA